MHKITSLYPQYEKSQDRRQQNIPVLVERRSGKERRSTDRIVLDRQLTKDLFEVKSQVAKLETMMPKLFELNVTKEAPTFGSMNNMTQDTLVKESKPDMAAIARQEAKLQDKASTSFQIGVIAAALAGAIAISFMGSTGAVIALGTFLYIGARVLKTMISKEIEEDKKSNRF